MKYCIKRTKKKIKLVRVYLVPCIVGLFFILIIFFLRIASHEIACMYEKYLFVALLAVIKASVRTFCQFLHSFYRLFDLNTWHQE